MAEKNSPPKQLDSGFVDPVTFMKLRHPDLYSDKLCACAMLFPVDEQLRDLAPEISARLDDSLRAKTLPKVFAYEAAHLCASPEARLALEIGPLMHLVRIQMMTAQGVTEPIIWNVLANNEAQKYVLEKRVGLVRVEKRSKPFEEALRERVHRYLAKEKTFLPSERWLKKMPSDLNDAVVTYAAPAKEGRFYAQRLRGLLAAFTLAPESTGRRLRIQGDLLRRQLGSRLIESIAREPKIEIAAPWFKNDLTTA